MEEIIMLTTSKEMLQQAAANGYAVPAINTQGGNYDIIWAVCKAAEDLGSPIMLAHYVSTGAYSGHDWFVNVCKWCASKVSVPVAIHLDHGVVFEFFFNIGRESVGYILCCGIGFDAHRAKFIQTVTSDDFLFT